MTKQSRRLVKVVEQKRQRGHDDKPKRLDAHLSQGIYLSIATEKDVLHASSVRASNAIAIHFCQT